MNLPTWILAQVQGLNGNCYRLNVLVQPNQQRKNAEAYLSVQECASTMLSINLQL